jgi:hypothetical protein
MTKVKLNVNKHCIEAAAKEFLRELVRELLNKENIAGELEKQVEILKEFLEKTEFGRVRAKFPELAGGTDMDVYLKKGAGGGFEILTPGRIIKEGELH